MIGSTLGHFRILGKLGAGTTGQVFLAEDAKLGREVALKVLPLDLTDEEHLQRFEREARVVARLNHPNIVTLFSIEEADDRRFLCMERLHGECLDELIPEQGMAIDRFFVLATQLASALAAAHKAGVTHRDLKPANIMVSDEGRLKVLDFGLAKRAELAAEKRAQLTQHGSLLGTLAYMAPEQIRGEPADPRSDVFALGILLHEMLAGQRPFRGSLSTLIEDIAHLEPPKVSEIRDDVPTALSDLISRCLEKEPASRFQDASELHRALADMTAAISSGSISFGPLPAAAPAKRKDWKIALAVAAAVIAAASSGVYLSKKQETSSAVARPAPDATAPIRVLVLPFQVQGSDDLAYLQDGMVNLLSTKLDGAGDLRSVDPRAVLGLRLASGGELTPGDARGAAQQLDAGLFLLGNLLAIGDRIQINASLYETGTGSSWPQQDPVAQASSNGSTEELFDLIDGLVAQLLGDRGVGPGGRITRLAAITTHSLPALKAYLNGEAAFRSGRFQDAFESFEEAVSVDPGFALSWYRLSTAAEWLSNDEMSRRGAAEAFRHSDRLSEHDRRLLEGFSASRRGAIGEAATIFREVLSSYPDDVEAWFQLGEIAFHHDVLHGVPIRSAIEPWEELLRFEPDHIVAQLHLARIYATTGDLEKIDDLASRFLAISPAGERTLEMRALRAYSHRDDAAIAEVTAELSEASDITLYISAAGVAIYLQDFAGAGSLLELMTDRTRFEEIRTSGHIFLAHLDLAEGRMDDARERLEKSLGGAGTLEYLSYFELAPFLEPDPIHLASALERLEAWDAEATPDVPERVAVGLHNGLHVYLKSYLSGLISAQLDHSDKTVSYVEALVSVEEPETAKLFAGDLAIGLRAGQALAKGQEHEALAILEETRKESWLERQVFTSPFFSRARERFLRAEMLNATEDYEAALRWYGSFEYQSLHGLIFVAPAHERRAQIYDRLGQTESAAQHYRRFIELWENADSALQPRVEAARQRLAEL